MIWTDDVLARLDPLVRRDGYPSVAEHWGAVIGQKIHPEQLRGAMRRYRARRQEPPRYVPEPAAPVAAVEVPIIQPRTQPRLMTLPDTTKVIRFAAIGDTHLASRYERLDELHAFYDLIESEGIKDVYHTGNFVDGEAPFNRDDIHVAGMDNQLLYFVQNYPAREGITTHYISGDDHEGWWRGINSGERLEDIARRYGRTDLRYLGHMEADVVIRAGQRSLTVRVLHAGGGSAAAVSYTSQKIVDSYYDDERPDILLVGHYHKAEFLPNYRAVNIVQTGAFQGQTPFMRKKRLRSDVGGWIISAVATADILRVQAEFISFTSTRWSYRGGE